MRYSKDEERWIERKAKEIARKTGWPYPIARSEAMAEFVRIQNRPKASVSRIGMKP